MNKFRTIAQFMGSHREALDDIATELLERAVRRSLTYDSDKVEEQLITTTISGPTDSWRPSHNAQLKEMSSRYRVIMQLTEWGIMSAAEPGRFRMDPQLVLALTIGVADSSLSPELHEELLRTRRKRLEFYDDLARDPWDRHTNRRLADRVDQRLRMLQSRV